MTRDLGATTPTVQPHPGDDSAQRIRAAIERLRVRQSRSTGTPEEVETGDNAAWWAFDTEVRTIGTS